MGREAAPADHDALAARCGANLANTPPPMRRRHFLASLAVGAALPIAVRHGGDESGPRADLARRVLAQNTGRLTTRPPAGGTLTLAAGVHQVPLADGREAQLLVPAKAVGGAAAPLALMLHGAGGSVRGPMRFACEAAEETGTLLLVPKSLDSTWDLLHGGFGADVAIIDRCLAWAFGVCQVDPKRLSIAGFSDGGSFALSLGLLNGDLFSHVVAFSPGFIGSDEPFGNPPVFISHGTADEILPIDRTSRRIVPSLKRRGYRVTYREFNGPHAVPGEIALEALAWVAKGAA